MPFLGPNEQPVVIVSNNSDTDFVKDDFAAMQKPLVLFVFRHPLRGPTPLFFFRHTTREFLEQ